MSRARASKWRSWIATLCVALLAFVTIEQATPAHAADSCDAEITEFSASAVAVMTDAALPQDEPGAPTETTARHHCCTAHTSNLPPLAAQNAPEQHAEALTPAAGPAAAPEQAPLGPDRPPKAIAIV